MNRTRVICHDGRGSVVPGHSITWRLISRRFWTPRRSRRPHLPKLLPKHLVIISVLEHVYVPQFLYHFINSFNLYNLIVT